MWLLYNLVTIVLALAATPVFCVRLLREQGFGNRWRQSMGLLSSDTLETVAGRDCIWIHAASVGEMVAASPVIRELRRQMPERRILVSTITTAGYTMARQILNEADAVIYYPLDLSIVTKRVIAAIQPAIFVPVETELWPNFIRHLAKRRTPIVMVNGRISDRSVKYYGYLGCVLKDILNAITMFCMQSEQDARHILQLGADPSRVLVTGNTKFDQTYSDISVAARQQLYNTLKLNPAAPVVVAGSTHPGEETIIAAAFSQIRQHQPTAQLIVAPRETLRAAEVVAIFSGTWTTVRRTQLADYHGAKPDVIILDTIGELGAVYSLGDCIFVGGSLITQGGHNVLEPAAHAKPILVGPHMFNFKASYALLSDHEACLTVNTAEQLADTITQLLTDHSQRQTMGNNALTVILANRGASARSAAFIQTVLSGQPAGEQTRAHNRPSISVSETIKAYVYRLLHDEERGLMAKCIAVVFRVLSVLYGAVISLRYLLYQKGILQQYRLPCLVISLGNITVGGTGKTPTAEKLATTIRDFGGKVAVLNRGYRSSWRGDVGVVSDGDQIYMTADEAGDEAYLLAKNLPGVPVLIGKNRVSSGQYAYDQFQVDVVILDDGYQHWQLERDLDIVLVDSLNAFGNKHLLPRGILREPLTNLSRADAILLTKVDQAPAGTVDALRPILVTYNPHAVIAESTHSPLGVSEIADWLDNKAGTAVLEPDRLDDLKILAFSGIGNPLSFDQTLSSLGAQLVMSVRYSDHYHYVNREMQRLMQQAVAAGAQALVTTAKDAVKIPLEFIRSERPLPVYVLLIRVELADEDVLLSQIKEFLRSGKR